MNIEIYCKNFCTYFTEASCFKGRNTTDKGS